ncbi:MAG: hypothetical protein M3O46_13930, partial [Myxococcota bacterium]|nr:hypothetical protein [Myxococcota bacterium]
HSSGGNMESADRMFRVLVLGGIALTGAVLAPVAGCSSSSDTADAAAPHDGSADTFADAPFDAFPTEGPDAVLLTDGGDAAADSPIEAFPQEGVSDAGTLPREAGQDADADADAATDAAADAARDAFPHEGPDTGAQDARSEDGG